MVEEEMFSYDGEGDIFSGDGKKTEFLGKLKAGESITIRFLTDIDKWHKAYKHDFVQVEDGKVLTKYVKGVKGLGSFVCINTKQNLRNGIVCPLCEAGLKPKAKFGVPVIDRATNSVKFYESSHATVYKQLMAEFDANGTVCDVDYKISRTGSTMADTKYSVSALRKTQKALTADEIKLADKIPVVRYFSSKKRDEILDILSGKKKEKESAETISEGEVEEPVPF